MPPKDDCCQTNYFTIPASRVVVALLYKYVTGAREMRRQENFNLDLESDCFEDQKWFGVIPGVHVAQVGKPCVRVKVRCSCWTKKGGHFHILVQLCWENDLSILIMIFVWLFLLVFLNFIFLSCLDWACGQRCYLMKYFNFIGCKVITSSKKGVDLWSVKDVSCWRLVCVAKVVVWLLISMRVVTDVQMTIFPKVWSVTRIAVKCILL